MQYHLFQIAQSQSLTILFFNNVSLEKVLSNLPRNNLIYLKEIYAYDNQNQYILKDFEAKQTVSEFQFYKQKNESLFFDTLLFEFNGLQIRVSDEYSYHITSTASNFITTRNLVDKLLDISAEVWKLLLANEEKYFLLSKKGVEAIFANFEDYLKSEFANFT